MELKMKEYFDFSMKKTLLAGVIFVIFLVLSARIFNQPFREETGLMTKEPEQMLDVVGPVSDSHIAVQSLFFHKPVRLHSMKIYAATYADTARMEHLQYFVKDSRNRILYSNAISVSEIEDNAWLELDLGGVRLGANERHFLYFQGAVADDTVVCPTFYTMEPDSVSDVLYVDAEHTLPERALCAVYEYDVVPMSGAVIFVYALICLIMLLLANIKYSFRRQHIPHVLAAVYVLLWLVLLVSILWKNDTINRILFNQQTAAKLLCTLFVLTFLVAGISMAGRIKPLFKKVGEFVYRFRWLFGALFFLAVFAVQYFLASNLYQRIGWDVGYVYEEATNWLTNENAVSGSYLKLNPNNIGIALVQYLIRGMVEGDGAAQYWALITVNILLIDFSIWLVYLCAKKIYGFGTAVAAVLFMTALFGFSGWMIVPYTDTYTIFIPILVLYLYCCLRDKRISMPLRCLCGLGIGFLAVWGYYLKPQCLIIYIAIAIVWVIEFIKRMWTYKKDMFRGGAKYGVLVLCMAVGLAAGFGSFRGLKTSVLPSDYDDKDAKPAMHFLMMGFGENPGSIGIGAFSYDDVNYIMEKERTEEKSEHAMERIKWRIKDYGLAGLLKHWYKKAVFILGDGSFFWQIEGSFYLEDYSYDGSERQQKLREYYYGRYGGYDDTKLQGMLGCFSGIWFFMLFMTAIPQHRHRDTLGWTGIVALAILGSILFPVLFEARSRYLINYLPLFAVMAGRGFISLVGGIKSVKKISGVLSKIWNPSHGKKDNL